MGSINFLKAEAGRQETHGTPVDPTYQLPFTGNYTDDQEEHTAPWDSGSWIAGEELVKVNDFASAEFSGSTAFELLPLFFYGGYRFKAPTDSFTYTDAIDLQVAGVPNPYTFRFGAVDEPLATGGGPAVQLANAYCQSLTLSGGVNARAVSFTSSWFAAGVDDNTEQGYPFVTNATPDPRTYMIALGNNFRLRDATTTGGEFTFNDDTDKTDCLIIDWELAINYGTQPKWGADGAGASYCGVRFTQPSIEFRPTIRTNAQTWQLIRTKYNKRTFQELELEIIPPNVVAPDASARFRLTGQWMSAPQPHSRSNDEVVMQPVFRAKRFPAQATTPHLFDWEIKGKYEHK